MHIRNSIKKALEKAKNRGAIKKAYKGAKKAGELGVGYGS